MVRDTGTSGGHIGKISIARARCQNGGHASHRSHECTQSTGEATRPAARFGQIPVCIGEYVGADVRGAFDKGSHGTNVLRPAYAHSTDDISVAHADRSEVIGVQVSSNYYGVVRAWPTSYLNVAAELVRPTPRDGFEGFFLPDDGLGNCNCVVLRGVPVLTTVHAAEKTVGHVGHIADRVHINDEGPEVSV